jgi:hypothetical protein
MILPGRDIGEAQRTKRHGTSQTKTLSAARLDAMHDAGVDLTPYLDLNNATRLGRQVRQGRVDVNLTIGYREG